MRERLIQLISNADEECKHSKDCKSCSGYGKGSQCMNYHIADYLLENGVVVPPCKVGTRVYSIALGKVYEWDICSYTVDLEGISFINLAFMEGNNLYSNTYSIEDIGKTVFLSREEAERALKGGAE